VRSHKTANLTGRVRASIVAGLGWACLALPVTALTQQATITPNYKDADIRQIIEAVGEVTGKNFILDPRVKAQVTMLSGTPMSPDAFYEAFLSILQVYGYVAVPSGDVVKILPDANARQVPGAETSAGGGRLADDIVTRVVAVKNVGAAQLVPILRPLIPQYGHLAAHPPSNILIISDRAANVERMLRIIDRIDQESSQDVEVLRLEHASAAEVVRVMTTLNQGAKAEGGAAPATSIVADERTNSVLISGDKNDRLRLRTLITHLDTPLEEGGDTRVRYLRYADAKDLATKLQTQYQKQATAAGGAQGAAPPTEKGDVNVWADESTNALIMTAPPKIMKSMMAVIDRIDIRRLQVLVEAIIVEITAGKAAQLGVTWAVADADFDNVAAVTKFPDGTGIVGLLGSIIGSGSGDGDGGTPADTAGLIKPGISVAGGRISDSGTNFLALLEALESDANTNIMGTPILVTMDNEEAEIKVGQEVPFVTGQYTNTGATGGNTSVNPFQTIQREQVGLTLKITPQINEGDAILLKIEQELSALQGTAGGEAADLITSNRSINTSVIVEDGGTLVLGGLIQDDLRESESRVPFLGSIPLVGTLFRSTKTDKAKTNLMIFIKPTILRDDAQAAFETDAKYNFVRNQQLAGDPDKVRLLRNETRPVLPAAAPAGPPVIDLRKLRPNGDASDNDSP
jgi:general secretion pathway protein D